MSRYYTAADRDAARVIVQAVVPQSYVVRISPHVIDGKLWVRIDDAPFSAILPQRIIRFGNSISYSINAPDALTYPPSVAAVFQNIRVALSASGINDVDISLSQAAAERQARQILTMAHSAHGRMQLAGLLAAAGVDAEAISEQLRWLDQTS
ncbi:hypothetical protein [Azospirillum brasilense]|uniref:hypothetical protein n=1 Tax=Azospirillum brasilense TaxID=192 RepID=UPI001EDB9D52|nr:hypothetical protein [Azospirillum brasilense]UKJ75963.1 hypothetical protein H1Q64_17265 [Azospirillum brasilense]